MNVTLKNDLLTVVADTAGAELHSIKNNRTGHEYLWQGDKTFWGRRSPVLFPIVGAVWNGEYRMDNTVYAMGQHGFARDSEFTVVEDCPENEAWFALEWSNAALARYYPRRFRLEIGYSLNGERIDVMWRVKNLDTRSMAFQIGAHPGFTYPDYNASGAVHGYFNIDGRRPLHAQLIESKGCVGAEEYDVNTDAEGMLELTSETFARDAIILAEGQVRRVSMLDKNKNPYLTLLFSAPVVGLWSPPAGNAPFVCIEPWWGRADRVGYAGGFMDREYVNVLEPGKTFSAGYMIIIDNL